ncbi:restriction endonuclease [Bombella sp. ESL0378]|uniref:restriction endonuclease n=1 Tax=Bombella sp. ESL0378 TaxID=2676442 RepID=UPI0012D875E6|nr:restriction endonuclease [Bombella sp. ESL0378]MUG05576.1 restriction endonuclease [Bombella sp. ESL0378]
MSREIDSKRLLDKILNLTEYQMDYINIIVDQLNKPFEYNLNLESDLINKRMLYDFGDILRIHHVFSEEALSKDRFEHAFERMFQRAGIEAKLAPRGNPGHDLTVNKQRISLKTQADRAIKENFIHISKFMELGKGEWTDKEEHLRGQLDRFYNHMSRYDRIFTLRKLRDPSVHYYELVEIPKVLLLNARNGIFKISINSKQHPKPGTCTVKEGEEEVFQLYFDGGTERKLQIKHLRKDFCITHATWKFPKEENKDELIV